MNFDPDFRAFLNSLPVRGGARTRITNCLYADGITSFDKLLSKTDVELLRLPFMGRVFTLVLTTALANRGLALDRIALAGERCPTCGQILPRVAAKPPPRRDAAHEP